LGSIRSAFWAPDRAIFDSRDKGILHNQYMVLKNHNVDWRLCGVGNLIDNMTQYHVVDIQIDFFNSNAHFGVENKALS